MAVKPMFSAIKPATPAHRPAHAFPRLGRKAASGFTLLEAMITIVILAILLATAVPSFQTFVASRAVAGQVSELASAIRLTRAEAIKRGVPVTLCRTESPDAASPACGGGGDWSDGWIAFVDRGTVGTVDDNDIVFLRKQPATNSGGIVRTPDTAITFQPSGVAPGAQSNFLIRPPLESTSSQYSALSRRICMNNTGNTRLIQGDGACGAG